MLLKSPLVGTSVLARETLDDGLEVLRCPQSGGIWIRPVWYWRWLDRHATESGQAGTDSVGGADVSATDSGAGKLCPEDGHFLIRHRVGHGLDFHVDRCGHCGGIWLDPGEWEALREKGLSEKLHLVFSSTWQARIREQERRVALEQLLTGKLGEDDYHELQRIAEWIATHPHRHEMQAFLREHFEKESHP
jgi:Zn-finger nucleic acid-binding protein